MTYQLHHGNLLDILPMMERDSIDAIVTDPPYGLDFMGKDWDHGIPGEHFWREAYRVAKPGAHLLAFGGTRTFHRLAVAIEDAGWEIRDTVMWVYGSGFPKSHDVSKAIDREAGAEREVIGRAKGTGKQNPQWNGTAQGRSENSLKPEYDATIPSTESAAEWDGWGTALKPAWEPIIVARKPLSAGCTVAENVQRYGTGAMNIDACRIECDSKAKFPVGYSRSKQVAYGQYPDITADERPLSRWPANLIHDGSAEVLAGFPMTGVSAGGFKSGSTGSFGKQSVYRKSPGIFDDDRDGTGYGDTGSAARFFYCAKASKADRDEGLEDLQLRDASIGDQRPSGSMSQRIHSDEGRPDTLARNFHPTVKPTSLMRYLCRLVTPPQGVILDPFMGSGSTGKAAILEGFNFVGVDTNIEYVEIAARRIEHACEKVGIVVEQPMMFETKRETVDRPKQLILL